MKELELPEWDEQDCAICGNVRYTTVDGKTTPCECRVKYSLDRQCMMWAYRNGVPEWYRTKTMDDMDQSNPKVSKAIMAAMGVAGNLKGGLLLTGTVGSGKTRILTAAIMAAKVQAKYWSYPVLTERARKQDFGEEKFDTNLIEECFTIPFLALDDVGALKLTERAEDVLWMIVDQRYSNGLPLLVATNLGTDKIGDRVYRRFKDPGWGAIVFMDIPSYHRVQR